MRNTSLIAVLTAASTLGSCQVIPSDILSVEARAIVVNDAEADLSGLGEEDVDLTGYGVHAAFMTGIVDVVAGIDQREFESSDTPELDLGLRKRLISLWKLQAYVEANLRYGFDLETRNVSEDYFGYNAGFGALVDLNDSMFLNFRVMYDTTSVDAGPTDVDIDGLIGTVGLGFKF
ncbi:hypothetical protein Poly30_17540 [Planctomycetes bacterium Poly30]|uniref:Outer membrane protein beta-barrel domain-containing protein n=1 Tax=Saltatorellus ferox TaxID=2528018 RepID=A0A518EQ75_9BACT|nr:hypothetical protein Poly30_17540 [Planctomycetes bacterium Poly30]